MEYYGHIIARLDGEDIAGRFSDYLSLVENGIAGFIVFGGELDSVREGIRELQAAADTPLIIASDLEQGLGQQVKGGTLFPPAMASARTVRRDGGEDMGFIKDIFTAYAEEALYAGINTILAPVVDINTNPENPIISVRSFGEECDTVERMSAAMIDTLQAHGIAACAKHFPGHGDTDVDSHLALPVLAKGMAELEETELRPFRMAVRKGVPAMMLAHMSVPAIEPENIPVSLSARAVEYIRKELGFEGLLMTDALDMGGLSAIGQNEAGPMALRAGVDILLHPRDPEELNSSLQASGITPSPERVLRFRRSLKVMTDKVPDFGKNSRLSRQAAVRAVSIEGEVRNIRPSSVVIIREDEGLSAGIFEEFIRGRFPSVRHVTVTGDDLPGPEVTGSGALTVVYSTTAAWKGGTASWLKDAVRSMDGRTSLFVVFGNPWIVHGMAGPRMLTFWCSEEAERAAVERFRDMTVD